jgi:hypothetical protein
MGKGGFIFLARRAAVSERAHAKELLDHACALAAK